jgi:glycosyltransferase involved in cell wall biosynthesis
MNILINALSARAGGGQTYLNNILKDIPDSSLKVFILSSKVFAVPYHPQIQIIEAPDYCENQILRAVWEVFALPSVIRKYKIDCLFCPGGLIPIVRPKNCKIVVMFRNMLPFWSGLKEGFPFGLSRFRLQLLGRLFQRSMRQADAVIFISQTAARFVTKELKLAVKEYTVIPHGVDEQFMTAGGSDVPWPSQVPEGVKYLLYVSILQPYKHQLEVVRGYKLWLDSSENKEVKLILAGPNNTDYGFKVKEEVSKLGIDSNVMFLGKVPHAELSHLYAHAIANIFASSCENCPNILLEKIASGRPLACLDVEVNREFGGIHVTLFSLIISSFVEALRSVISKEQNSGEHNDRISFASLNYSWLGTTALTWRFIKNTF